METSLIEIFKLAAIVGSPIATLCWHILKKVEARQEKIEARQDNQDKKMTEIEKAVIEIRTEFKFTSRDIKEIKEMLVTLTNK